MSVVATVLFVLVGLVNLAPAMGAVSTDRLQALYGVALEDPNLVILMRHRAVLFAIVGGLLLVAAVHPPLRPAAVVAGLVSMLSFVVVAWVVGEYNAQLQRVALIDVVASVLLVVAALLSARV